MLAQPACVYGYVCLPRAVLWLVARGAESPLALGILDRRLAYVGVLLGGYHLLGFFWPKVTRHALIAWLHIDFLAGCVETGAWYAFGIGYSPLFFYHAGVESIRLAFTQYWPDIILTIAALAIADRVLRRVLSAEPTWRHSLRSERVAVVVVVLFGVRSVDILHRHGVGEEFAPLALTMNWTAYVQGQQALEGLDLDATERTYLRALGIGGFGRRQRTRPAAPPLNLVTIYLEGFQANFAQAWDSPFAGLTPHLDRFASRFVRFENFYNAVTPTINALVSSQCGIISEIENGDLNIDRGFTRNLACLSDRLHDAGYYQVFLGGADTRFSGKGLFLGAHHYDEVWGWEQWSAVPAYGSTRRNDWGLHDTDLAREAITRLSTLRKRGPFHLSLLMVNTHPPGFVAPDCADVFPGLTMLSAIHCTDYAVGLLLDSLEREGYFDDTVIAIMGDHMMFPSAENTALLGPVAGEWFGKVYMAVSYPRVSARVIRTASYTPDFAAIALDALRFRPVPRFPFAQSTLTGPDRPRTLVARHFQILDGHMIPPRPNLSDLCDPATVTHTTIHAEGGTLSDCERDKIIDLVEAATAGQPLRNRSSPDRLLRSSVR